jgi:adenine-specific DNA-methyltransferase
VPELVFKGKEFVYNHHLAVPYHPLVAHPDKSIGAGTLDGNLIIHGDNLKALKSLLPHYAGKVDCIFIDPPYNTGTESWCYSDNVNSPMMREWFDTNPITKEDLLRHDKWLCMMYPRVKLLHELLAESGTFWMTIDDNEVHHARAVLDEIFGQDKFFACVVWQKRTSPESRLRLGAAHDYILVYGKGVAKESLSKLSVPEEEGEPSNSDNDTRGAWTSTDLTAQGYRPNQMYKIVTPSGAEYEPPSGRCWAMLEPEFLRLKADGRIWFGVNGDARPRTKTFLSESDGISAWTWWTNKEAGDNQESKKEILRILGADNPFDYPKPLRLLSRIIDLATDENSLVLDSFAGSGTTAHAVLQANAKDNGHRKFILVEGEDYADKITAERVRRVINGYSFQGTLSEELFREKLSYSALKKIDKLFNQVAAIENLRAPDFDEFAKTVVDDCFVVTGKTKVTKTTKPLGGTFTFFTLGEPTDLNKILTGENLPDYETIGAWLFHTATGEPIVVPAIQKDEWYLGESRAYYVWLVYKPELAFLKSRNSALTLDLAEKISKAKKGKKHLVFSASKFVPNKLLLPLGVEHVTLPFGLFRIEKS